MISESLKKYIPSRSYREYLERIDHSFTDFEEASILCQIMDDVFLLHEELDKIRLRTEDENLNAQIEDYLSFERRKIAHFCDNRNRTHVYIVQKYDDDCCEDVILAYTQSYETALAIGRKEGVSFEIRKERMLDDLPANKSVRKDHWNPPLAGEESVTTYEADDYLDSEGTFFFNPDGVLEHYYLSWESNLSDQEIAARAYASDQFCQAYVDLPFPFEKGDFVRFVTNSKRDSSLRDDVLVGIVDVSPEDWAVRRQRAQTVYTDASDASVTVQFLYRNGEFGHDHISPYNLEKTEIDRSEPWYELAFLAQGLVMGDADIGFFTHFQQDYKDYLAWKKECAMRDILKNG